MSGLIHKCSEAECSYFGKPSARSCGCHVTPEKMLADSHAELVVALRRLAGNAGALGAFEPEVRDAVGNTNWQCLMDAVANADAAIAKARGEP